MKACTKCSVSKPLSAYYFRDKKTGVLHNQCKECYKQHRSTYYTAHYAQYREEYLARARVNRNRLKEIFRGNMLSYLQDKACIVCGEADLRVLEFDHIDPKTKSFSISQAVKLGYSWDEVLDELQKCQILCANCHKKRTAIQFGWYKS